MHSCLSPVRNRNTIEGYNGQVSGMVEASALGETSILEETTSGFQASRSNQGLNPGVSSLAFSSTLTRARGRANIMEGRRRALVIRGRGPIPFSAKIAPPRSPIKLRRSAECCSPSPGGGRPCVCCARRMQQRRAFLASQLPEEAAGEASGKPKRATPCSPSPMTPRLLAW